MFKALISGIGLILSLCLFSVHANAQYAPVNCLMLVDGHLPPPSPSPIGAVGPLGCSESSLPKLETGRFHMQGYHVIPVPEADGGDGGEIELYNTSTGVTTSHPVLPGAGGSGVVDTDNDINYGYWTWEGSFYFNGQLIEVTLSNWDVPDQPDYYTTCATVTNSSGHSTTFPCEYDGL